MRLAKSNLAVTLNKMNDGATQIRLLVSCGEIAEAKLRLEAISAVAPGKIIGQVAETSAALNRAALLQPDMLLAEYRCADLACIDLLLSLHDLPKYTQVVLLCDECSEMMIADFISRGVDACFSPPPDPSVLAQALVAVHKGDLRDNSACLVQAFRRQACEHLFSHHMLRAQVRLTSREWKMLHCIGARHSVKETANDLQLSMNAVRTHLRRIASKLQADGHHEIPAILELHMSDCTWQSSCRAVRPHQNGPQLQAATQTFLQQPANQSFGQPIANHISHAAHRQNGESVEHRRPTEHAEAKLLPRLRTIRRTNGPN